MARLEVGVAVLVRGRIGVEVDVLRRALGDPDLDRTEPHITLVPPLRLRAEQLDEALALLRHAASGRSPFDATLGPPATFLPVSPTVHLPVTDPSGALVALRGEVFRAPLEKRTNPFAGHVTLLAAATESRIRAACEVLSGYTATMVVPRISLMHQPRGERRWSVLADVDLDGVRRVGAGPLQVELSTGTVIDPSAVAHFAGSAGSAGSREFLEFLAGDGEPPAGSADACPVFVTARREGRVVGMARGSTGEQPERVFVDPAARGQGIGTHLVREWRFRVQRRAAR